MSTDSEEDNFLKTVIIDGINSNFITFYAESINSATKHHSGRCVKVIDLFLHTKRSGSLCSFNLN